MKIREVITITIISAIFCCVFLSGECCAEADFGYEEIIGAIPENSRENVGKYEDVLEIAPKDIFEDVISILKEEAVLPVRMFLSLTAVIMLCALINSVRDSSGSGSMSEIFSIVGVLACSGMLCVFMSEVIIRARTAVDGLTAFLTTYIPAFAGIMAVNGEGAAAAVYNTLIIIATQLFSQMSSVFLLPLSSSTLGVSIAGAVNPELHIERLAEMIKKAVTWALGLTMTVFTGLLSIQGLIAASADSVALRTAKFTVSGAVPIIGGSVSEALSTVKSSFLLLKSSTGGIGIISMLVIMIPAILSAVCFKLSLASSRTVSEMFGVDKLSALMKCSESVVDIIIALMVSFVLLTVISTSVILAIGNGAAV